MQFIFLRPMCLMFLIPVLFVAWYLWKKPQGNQDWFKICDKVLLEHFVNASTNRLWVNTWTGLVFSLIMFVVAAAGPSWQKQAVKTGKLEKAAVILLDLSSSMLLDDISPTRLARSKLVIGEVLHAHQHMQWGFVVFTDMPYVVTPVSTDIANITNFLPIINPDILPSKGYNVQLAVKKAQQLLRQAHVSAGRIIVLSSRAPDKALNLDKNGIAWINVFERNANGADAVWPIKQALQPLNSWLDNWRWSLPKTLQNNQQLLQNNDLGRVFLLIGMIPFGMIFRKGWFLRLWV